ncbi:MAG: ATP phosphoribosyltransferase regulatory subunit [Alphaproteobacteria bacterium]|nr:ATP phosphoribosyltransferase regulatory subunit [Alphaproteobacteria bacterium]
MAAAPSAPTADREGDALLPAGLRDLLPEEAGLEAHVIATLLARFAAQGYERVAPPLVEFESGLLAGLGAAHAAQVFRLMDPVSQRMMGLAADMTPQVVRIATTRLARAPRPLRLSYAGQVVRVRGTQLRPERQFGQVGAELIGAEGIEADAEAILLAAESLAAVGVAGLSIDIAMPPLVPQLGRALALPEPQSTALREALDRKDAAAVAAAAGPAHGDLFLGLLRAAGPAQRAVAALQALRLPGQAALEAAALAALVDRILAAAPHATFTVDPVEFRGFAYEEGVAFTLFARGVRGELGRGGRYRAGGEPATGFTIFTDTLLRAVPPLPAPRRVYVPLGAPLDAARRLRAEGWTTIAGMAVEPDARDQSEAARRLGCDHIWRDGAPRPLAPASAT